MKLMNHPESAPTATPAPVKKKRWLFALKLTAAAGAIATLLVVIATIVAVFSIVEPKNEFSTNALLAAAPSGPTSAMPANREREKRTPKNPILATSTTLATAPDVALQYAAFIPDMADIPEAIKANRTRINAQFDRVLLEISKYERAKLALSPEQRSKTVEHIMQDYRKSWIELRKIMDPILYSDWGHALDARHAEYMKWRYNATIENCAQSGRWMEAARTSKDYLDIMRVYWSLAQDQSQPVFKSRYFKEFGAQDWKRIIYYARQSGELPGYRMIAGLLWSRGKERLHDAVGMAALRMNRRLYPIKHNHGPQF